jgi:hypothetical protein
MNEKEQRLWCDLRVLRKSCAAQFHAQRIDEQLYYDMDRNEG